MREWLRKVLKRNYQVIGIYNHSHGVTIEPMGPYTKKRAVQLAENLTDQAEATQSSLRFFIKRIADDQ